MRQELVELIPEVIKILRTTNRDKNDLFEYLGSGISRSVIRFKSDPNSVFKITRWNTDEDNQREMELYDRLPDEDKKYFAAPKSLVQIDKNIGVMEMEYVPGHRPGDNLYESYPDVYDYLNKKYGLWDLHGGNYRIVDNQPKIFDYGFYN